MNWIWLIEDWLASWRHSTHFNSVGALGQVSIVSHSYQIYFSFPGSDLNLDCGLCDHVIRRFASVGIRVKLQNKVISFCYFHFFSVPLSFSMFASIFLFFVFTSSKQKKQKKCYISSCYCLLYLYIKKKERERERERERLDEIWRMIEFLPQKHNS
jgi:hypothetical protein